MLLGKFENSLWCKHQSQAWKKMLSAKNQKFPGRKINLWDVTWDIDFLIPFSFSPHDVGKKMTSKHNLISSLKCSLIKQSFFLSLQNMFVRVFLSGWFYPEFISPFYAVRFLPSILSLSTWIYIQKVYSLNETWRIVFFAYQSFSIWF